MPSAMVLEVLEAEVLHWYVVLRMLQDHETAGTGAARSAEGLWQIGPVLSSDHPIASKR